MTKLAIVLVFATAGCSSLLGIDDFRVGDAGGSSSGDGPPRDASPIVDGHLVDGFGVDGNMGCDPSSQFGTPQPLAALSAGTADAARLNANETTVFLERDGAIYTASRSVPTAAFGAPTLIGALDTGGIESGPSISFDETELAYARDGQLFLATRSNSTVAFTVDGTPITELNGASTEKSPFLGFMELWFVSDRSLSGNTSLNIWKADLNIISGNYEIQPEPGGLNTASAEDSPVVTFGGGQIYFASDRDGSYDIFTATELAGSYTNLVKLTTISDSTKNERPTHISFDQCRLYFSQDGDIFVATRTQ